MALARRKEVPVSVLVKVLESPRLKARYGACKALAMHKNAAAAVLTLQITLNHGDLWLRISAAKPMLPRLRLPCPVATCVMNFSGPFECRRA